MGGARSTGRTTIPAPTMATVSATTVAGQDHHKLLHVCQKLALQPAGAATTAATVRVRTVRITNALARGAVTKRAIATQTAHQGIAATQATTEIVGTAMAGVNAGLLLDLARIMAATGPMTAPQQVVQATSASQK